jgi:hypothetical protein
MICPTCSAAGQRSTLRIIPAKPAIHPLPKDEYFDEAGEWHSHNPNVIITHYRCSKGHKFSERSSWQCSVCGYKACEAEVLT